MIQFTVLGKPKTKARPYFGKGRAFTPAKTAEAEAIFVQRAAISAPPSPLRGPLALEVRFYFEVPKSWSRKKRAQVLPFHTSKPDADNLVKLVKDSMNGVFWIDDSQVCVVSAAKLYDEVPRTEVTLRELGQGGEV